MITVVGTGHVFKIAEPVSFIVRNTWPDAVLVELDAKRYDALVKGSGGSGKSGASGFYRRSAKYQDRVSEMNETQTGSELLAAINAGVLAGAEIICIDMDAERAVNEMWEEMPFSERLRYNISSFRDSVFKRRGIGKIGRSPENDADYVEEMRRRYPTLVRKLIDERDEHMSAQICKAAETYANIVVVVGDAHVQGLVRLIGRDDVATVRLCELLDREKLDKVKARIWGGDTG
ncbi:MAG: TraB/GumN family protein [Candidatus Methanoplasma sp.]|jgi:pheromone shutdown protein TraB|nr:TraB/GumN family protein [Candidatus Methanoplasma sp.]